MENNINKYALYQTDSNGKLSVNGEAFELADKAFELFKELFDTDYGSINEDQNLVSIHTGGWSDNEALIAQLKDTAWWIINYSGSKAGGHYYFNTDKQSEMDWDMVKIKN